MKTLVLEPLIPLSLWAGLAVAAVLLLLWYARDCARRLGRGRLLAVVAMMTLAIGLPLAVLLNPVWIERVPPPAGKPLLSILVDASASMATPDGANGQTRFAEARELAMSLEAKLRDQYDVRLRTFAESVHPAEAADLATQPPDGAATDLASALHAALESDRPQGQAVVLASDGIHNAGGGDARVVEEATLGRALSAPIYTRAIGGQTEVRDLAIEVHSPQELAFVGQNVPVRLLVRPRGLGRAQARVALWDGDKEIERRDVVLAAEGETEVEFHVRHAASGVFQYEFRADPLPQEATLVNNRSTYLLRVIDEPIRLLLLEGKPYWDTKFLMRTLATDQAIELVSVVQLAEGRFLQRTLLRGERSSAAGNDDPTKAADADAPAAADRAETWKIIDDAAPLLGNQQSLSTYQIVVLGRDADVYLTDAAMLQLRRWLVRDGGSLVCFRGPPAVAINDRLRQFLPVRWNATRESRFRMKLTESGKDLRWVPTAERGGDPLAQMPSLASLAAPGDVQPQAVVWAVADVPGGEAASPAVTALPYGMGRVVVVEGAGMWRWAFLAPQYQQQELIYGALWHSLVRWLVSHTGLLPTQKWSLASDKIRFNTTEAATATLLLRESTVGEQLPSVELTGGDLPSARSINLVPAGAEPGAYRIAMGKLAEGRYQARIAGSDAADPTARTVFEVRANVDEVLELKVNSGLLARIADTSGGAELQAADAGRIAAQIDEHMSRAQPERVRSTNAWDRWWVLAGVFALWSMAWSLRRRSGLT